MQAQILGLIVVISSLSFLQVQASWNLTVNAIDFQRYYLTGGDINEVYATSNLKGNGSFIRGWFEYDISIPSTGWYKLTAQSLGYGQTIEFIFDGVDRRHPYFPTVIATGFTAPYEVGKYYLTAGTHSLRLQKYDNAGFGQYDTSDFKWFIIAASAQTFEESHYIYYSRNNTVYKVGDTIVLGILFGTGSAVNLTAQIANVSDPTQYFYSASILLSPATPPKVANFSIPVTREGSFVIVFFKNGTKTGAMKVPWMVFYAIDTTPVSRTSENMTSTLVQTIDCVATAPFLEQEDGSEIITSTAGKYRQAIGYVGWNPSGNDNSSFMAYRLVLKDLNTWHKVEVFYPDDSFRGFSVAVIDEVGTGYPPNSGSESGWEFSVTNSTQRCVMYYYSRTLDPTVIMWNDMGGVALDVDAISKIAITSIKASKVSNPFPAMATPRSALGQRKYIYWYEEAWSYVTLFGGADLTSADSVIKGTEGWIKQLAYAGFSTAILTVVSYSSQLYPSSYEVGSSSEWRINAWTLALTCEKYGLDWIAEFAPSGNALMRNTTSSKNDYRRNLSINRLGEDKYNSIWFATKGPLFNIMLPEVQQWHLNLIGEFVDQARYYQTLSGISIRIMPGWYNAGFCNMYSMDWIYDDWSIQQFTADTGNSVPVSSTSSDRYNLRYNYLTNGTMNARWKAWRSGKILAHLKNILTRIRKWNTNMQLYVHIFEGFPTYDPTDWGIDPITFNQVDGLHLINAQVSHGRRRYYKDILRNRDQLINPDQLLFLHPAGYSNYGAYFDITAQYFENSDIYVQRRTLGYDYEKDGNVVAEHDPAGRHALERYALALAIGDAFSLGDGGDQVQTGAPIIREFIAEYRFLPLVKFTARADAVDPVSIWEYRNTSYFMFYVVNRERFSSNVSITISGTNTIRRVTTGETITAKSGVITFTLLPYQLRVFTALPAANITKVTITYNVYWKNLVQSALLWMEDFSAKETSHITFTTHDWLTVVQNATKAARVAFNKGYYWSTRTILERANLSMAISGAGVGQPVAMRNVTGPIDLKTEWIDEYDSTVLLKANLIPPPVAASAIDSDSLSSNSDSSSSSPSLSPSLSASTSSSLSSPSISSGCVLSAHVALLLFVFVLMVI